MKKVIAAVACLFFLSGCNVGPANPMAEDANTLGFKTFRSWGFVFPQKAKITGIKVEVRGGGLDAHLRVGQGDSSTTVGNVSIPSGVVNEYTVYGGENDLWGAGGFISPNTLSSDYFTFAINSETLTKDDVRMTVYYQR